MDYLVIPSIREAHLKQFLDSWQFGNVIPIVIEDKPEKTFKLCIEHHYSWQEIDDNLKSNAWIISHEDSAIRCYGFLRARQLGAEIIYTLDDDCLPIAGEDFFATHRKKLNESPAWTEIIPGFRTRGLPYFNKGKLQDVVASVGLWTSVPDFDAIQTLSAGQIDDFVPPANVDRILPSGQFTPICGMNLAFKSEVAVLAYFPLMGNKSPFKRFDDIWFGIIFKKICDHLHYRIACGHPFIKHSRASDPFTNLVKEAPGIKRNETFWEAINGVDLLASTPKECMHEVGSALACNKDDYLSTIGEAIMIWSDLF